MEQKNREYFESLKKEVVNTFLLVYPAVSKNIKDWKGQTISFFQGELMEKVNDSISEKWFYNHMKSDAENLPRIDVLNMLSRYAGYKDWNDFMYQNRGSFKEQKIKSDKSNRMFWIVPLLTLASLGIIFMVFTISGTREYEFCFNSFDNYAMPVKNMISVEFFNDDESNIFYQSDSNSCVQINTNKINVKFAVKSAYFIDDTISRTLKKFSRSEVINLQPDDYALMIHFYSTKNTIAWEKRKIHLNKILHEDAMIFEVIGDKSTGIELYDKQEFISKLLLPTSGLKNLEILDKSYSDEKIAMLRFRQIKEYNENQ